MSYEGYTQALCEKGHQYNVGQYQEDDGCPYCGAKTAWSHEVDQTNGCYYDDEETENAKHQENCPACPLKLEVKEATVYDECPTCQHKKILSYQTYKRPDDRENQS